MCRRFLLSGLCIILFCSGCHIRYTDPYAGQYDPNRSFRSEGFNSAVYHVLGVGEPQGVAQADTIQRELMAQVPCNNSWRAQRTLKQVKKQLANTFPDGAVSLLEGGQLLRVSLSGTNVYDSGHEHLRPLQYGRLHALMTELQSYGTLRIKIIGHADSVDTQSYNYQLSKQRAEHIARYAMAYDVPSEVVSVEAQGELEPAESNDTASGRARNRRVILEICSI